MRRTKREDVRFDLFPFLSVLVCSIGAMTLLVLGTSRASYVGGVEMELIDLMGQGKGTTRDSVDIDCQDDHVVLYGGRVVALRAESVPVDGLDDPAYPFLHALDVLKANRETTHAVMLVRPDGIQTFYRVRSMLSAAGIEFGFKAAPYPPGVER